jgi:hypothetical protein
VVSDSDDGDELAFEDIRYGVREASEDVPTRAVFRRPATGVVDDERDSSLDQSIEAASNSAVASGVEAKALKEISLGLLEETIAGLSLATQNGLGPGEDVVSAHKAGLACLDLTKAPLDLGLPGGAELGLA